jgi:hypothetical protein
MQDRVAKATKKVIILVIDKFIMGLVRQMYLPHLKPTIELKMNLSNS